MQIIRDNFDAATAAQQAAKNTEGDTQGIAVDGATGTTGANPSAIGVSTPADMPSLIAQAKAECMTTIPVAESTKGLAGGLGKSRPVRTTGRNRAR